MKLQRIQLKFIYKNKYEEEYTISARIESNGNWSQWGQDTKTLGGNVDLLAAMADIITLEE